MLVVEALDGGVLGGGTLDGGVLCLGTLGGGDFAWQVVACALWF